MQNEPTSKLVSFDGTYDPSTGHISLGAQRQVIHPTVDDFIIPDTEPVKNSHWDVEDTAFRVRNGMWQIIDAEKGLDSLKMARFLRRLTKEQRQTIYNDVFLGGVPFPWLMCVRPSVEDTVIAEIQSMLDEPNKHCIEFYRRRTALEKLIGDNPSGNADKRFQHRNNARYVRSNPTGIRHSVKTNPPDTDEKFYRNLLEMDDTTSSPQQR